MICRLYSLYSLDPALRGKHKIGISDDVERRRVEIEYGIQSSLGRRAKIRVAIAVPIFWSKRWEGWLHRKLADLRVDVPYHSGHTEWFRTQNERVALLYLLLLWYLSADLTLGRVLITAVIFRLPFPLDSVLKLGAILLLQVSLILGTLYGLLWIASGGMALFSQ